MEEKQTMSVEQSESEKELQGTSREDYVAPGVSVVRANTPRPLPFSLIPAKTELPLSPSQPLTDFPGEAPDAPPLPEDDDTVNTSETKTEPKISQALKSSANEFIWLFEYALDMDPVHLNRPERLNGSAFAYGPAVLQGYRLVFEGLDPRTNRVLASLDPMPDQEEKEIWGILYRVPRRFTRSERNETPLLDKVHCAETFVPAEVKVRESYRQREISCVVYIASETARLLVRQLPEHSRMPETAYLTRLLQVARRQKLPASYIHTIEELVRSAISTTVTPLPLTPVEHNTEPLPAVITETKAAQDQPVSATEIERPLSFWNKDHPARMEHWLMAFAIYVSLLLVCTLILALIQGLGFEKATFNDALSSLGIPWYAFLYGLAGGCSSCVISLGRTYSTYPPAFVVLTWFVRPFLGAFLGALAYLFLTSGIILISAQPAQHFALCAIISAIAGFCEGQIFLRKSKAPVHH